MLTEAGPKKRASLHLVEGEAGLAALDRGGLEVLEADLAAFRAALLAENHTLKRALTDPRLFERHRQRLLGRDPARARLSPVAMTRQLTADEVERLFAATRATLVDWIDRLRAEAGEGFPEKVTAFRPEHGGARQIRQAVPGLRHADPAHPLRRQRDQLLPALPDRGQAAGRPRLLAPARKDWPRTIEELERLGRS